jgi:hypothetical protein
MAMAIDRGNATMAIRDCSTYTIGIGRALNLGICRLAACAAFADPGYVTHDFDSRDNRHETHADDDGGVELDAPIEGCRQFEQTSARHVAETDLTHQVGDQISCNQAD